MVREAATGRIVTTLKKVKLDDIEKIARDARSMHISEIGGVKIAAILLAGAGVGVVGVGIHSWRKAKKEESP